MSFCLFYVSEGGRFVSTELTRGPWDPDAQHAGPPAALIARELERSPEPGPGARPLAGRADHLRDPAAGADRAARRSSAEVVRPGRASSCSTRRRFADADGEQLRPRLGLAARRPRRRAAGRASAPRSPRRVPGPGQAAEPSRSSTPAHDVGYHTAMEYRFVARRVPRARPGDGLDADALAAGRGRGADAAAAGAGRRRLGQRRERDARPRRATCSSTSTSPSTCTACRSASGSCLDAITTSRSRPGSGSPTRRCTTSAARSAGRCRRCSSASAEHAGGSEIERSNRPSARLRRR